MPGIAPGTSSLGVAPGLKFCICVPGVAPGTSSLGVGSPTDGLSHTLPNNSAHLAAFAHRATFWRTRPEPLSELARPIALGAGPRSGWPKNTWWLHSRLQNQGPVTASKDLPPATQAEPPIGMARLGATFRATLSHIEVPGKAVNPIGVATYRAVPGPASGPISGTCLVPSYRAAVPYTAADSAIVTVRTGFIYIPGSGLPDYLVHQVPCTWSREIVHTGEDVQATNPSDATAGCLNPHTPAH